MRHLRIAMVACLALIFGLTACEEAIAPAIDDVVTITSPSSAFTSSPQTGSDKDALVGEGEVAEEDSLQLIAQDRLGNDVVAHWSSSSPEIASISASGMVSGLIKGEVIITARTKSRIARVLIRVAARRKNPPEGDGKSPPDGQTPPDEETPPVVASIEVEPASAGIEVGDTTRLAVQVKDAGGNVLTDRAISWSSSSVAVARVSEAGLVTGTGAGTATITATVEGKSGSATVTVRAVAPPPPPPSGPLLVFPGAEGTGTQTPAGRGGKVIRVTNLNDSGAGSLREALSASGPRIVIFDVSGTITLNSHLRIRDPYVTVAGQTAPSPGIMIRGATLEIQTHDVLIQHLRFRVGDDPSGPNPGSRDAIRILGSGVKNVVIDHISASWAIDEIISTYNHTDITISNSIFSEALGRSIHPEGEHSKGVFIAEGSQRLTLIGNLIAHNRDRNPAVKGNTTAIIVNNLIYNWGNNGAVPVWDSNSSPTYKPVRLSVVGNVFIPGADTPERALCLRVHSTVTSDSKVYLSDNRCNQVSSDPWSGARNDAASGVKASSAPVWTTLTVRRSGDVENWVLANAGARPADRDAVDARVVNEVRTRTGRIIDRPGQVGGWPSLAQNRRALTLPANPNGIDPRTGYTNIEVWLHGLAAEVEGRR